jgi:hypothetical protein
MATSNARPTLLDGSVTAVRKMKEDLVRSNGIGADVPPMLAVGQDGVLGGVFGMDWADRGEAHRACMERLAVVAVLTDYDEFIFAIEGYGTSQPVETDGAGCSRWTAPGHQSHLRGIGPEGGPAATDSDWSARRLGETFRRGELAERFAQGDPTVYEGVMISSGMSLLEVHLSPPPRNDPCPCGSGIKAKRCCWSPTR